MDAIKEQSPWPYFSHRWLSGLTLTLLICNGCGKPARPVARQSSSVQVVTTADLLQIQTPLARFRVSQNGYLQAGLLRDGKVLSLDAPTAHGGTETNLDLAHAKIQDANGKLGAAGKRIEIAG